MGAVPVPHFVNTIQFNSDLDLSALHALERETFPFLLQSVARGGDNAKYDILFALPGDTLVLHDLNTLSGSYARSDNDFLSSFDQWFADESVVSSSHNDVPFSGGWFVFLAYELAQQIEPTLRLPTDSSSELPVAFATRVPAAIIRNHHTGEVFGVAENSDVLEQLELKSRVHQCIVDTCQNEFTAVSEENPDTYIQNIKRILQYIKDGDVFQVNLSRLWQAQANDRLDVHELYRQLCKANPAPFAASVHFGGESILSSSPERLVCSRQRIVETRPIAGTRPRARDLNGEIDLVKDRQLLDELIKHPKERAEHVMLIDLERNDLGRVCEMGSVEVNELMVVESYEHVHHIVSNVRGRLRADVRPGQVLRAVFPGGTITGCPKVRCMEIIGELEATPREAYTGSLGYINLNGDMDFNILIRSIQVSKNKIHFRAGAGIVYDSLPDKEVDETRTKALGMLNALTKKY